MSITEKKDNTDLATGDLSPITFTIPTIKDKIDELNYMKDEYEELKTVKEHNIKLALKLKEIKTKYTQEKTEHNNTKKTLRNYYKAERDLNIKNIKCPFLNKEISLTTCEESCSFGYCTYKYNCAERKESIRIHFKL